MFSRLQGKTLKHSKHGRHSARAGSSKVDSETKLDSARTQRFLVYRMVAHAQGGSTRAGQLLGENHARTYLLLQGENSVEIDMKGCTYI